MWANGSEMDREVTECPKCGTWSGPSDGDASCVIRETCDECKAMQEAA
jgi:hypothetical protein